MGSVDVYTADHSDDMFGDSVISAAVDGSGNLTFQQRDGDTLGPWNIKGPTGSPGAAGSQIYRWSNTQAYIVGDLVAFAGKIYKCTSAHGGAAPGKPPALFGTIWTSLTADTDILPVADPNFDSDVIGPNWNAFWTVASPTTSLTTTAGEFETGKKALKSVLPAGATQRLYPGDEFMVRGGEVISVKIRAKVLAGTVKINGNLQQNDEAGQPEPFGTGSVQTAQREATIVITSTSWATYTMSWVAQNAKPRATAQLVIFTDAGVTGTIVIDRVEYQRESMALAAWPVGSIFMNVNNVNPSNLLGGGTWVAWGTGRMPIAVDPSNPNYDTPEEVGGSATHTHTVSVVGSAPTDAVGDHAHGLSGATSSGVPSGTGGGQRLTGGSTNPSGAHSHTVVSMTSSGTSAGPNTVPFPYISVYMWKRTA